jgi:hypothetical protein
MNLLGLAALLILAVCGFLGSVEMIGLKRTNERQQEQIADIKREWEELKQKLGQ